MKNIIYQNIVAADANTQHTAILYVTEESNCHIVWLVSNYRREILDWFSRRDQAIEFGVKRAQDLIAERKAKSS